MTVIDPLDAIRDRARHAEPRRHIVLAEGEDPRVVEGGLLAVRDGLAKITLLGDEATVREHLRAQIGDAPAPDGLGVIDPRTSEHADALADALFERRQHKGVDRTRAARDSLDPLNFAALMVHTGLADGTVAGAVATTAQTVRAALQMIGKHPDAGAVSSFFLIVLDPARHGDKAGAYVFSDAGLTIEPTVDELAGIVQASADSFGLLVGEAPRVAMLSFSTLGSATHPSIDKIIAARDLARAARPDLTIEGELQFDAAFVPSVAASKAPDSAIEGDANVFVFPSLEAANIAYKIAQRIGGATAIGPILQGLAKPANDLSRGCTAEDVRDLIAVTVVQAG